MRKLRGFNAVMLLMAVTAVPVSGQFTNLFSGSYTGGSDFATTAAITLAWRWEGAGLAVFRLNVENQGIYGEVYKAIGLINIPAALKNKVGPAPGYTNSLSGWTAPPPNDLSGLPPASWGWVSPDPAPTGGLMAGQTGTFYFQISGITGGQIAQIGAGVHGIAGPDGCSTKLGVLPAGGGTVTQAGPYSCGPTTVTPEPATVVLLATGLLGLAGAARLRRRQDAAVEGKAGVQVV